MRKLCFFGVQPQQKDKNMKSLIVKSTLLSLMIISFSGCFLKSVHPLITSEDAILVEGLDGVFETEDQRWTFASDKDPSRVADLIRKYPDESVSFDPREEDSLKMNAYLVLFENKQSEAKPTLFLGMVGEINGDRYLNLKILDVDLGMSSSFVESHRFYVNTFSKIKLDNEKLVMEPLASSWIADQIQNNRVRIKHEVVRSEYDDSEEILVTASTEELQQFIKKYGKEEDAYEDPITLTRSDYEVQ